MDVISYAKAKAVDDRLTQALAAGNNPSGWMADRDAINVKLADASKISQTIENGISVINGTLDSPVDVQVQGRTLISMGQSVLQNGKNFVLADKKTKIRTLGSKSAQTQGVAKFVQTVPTTDTANFVGKIVGSTVENPHDVKHGYQTTLQNPITGTFIAQTQGNITNIQTLNGGLYPPSTSVNGNIAQVVFTFDIISEIERQIGRIPKATTADKIQWCKDNVYDVKCRWSGYGSGPNGNKATLNIFNTATNQWVIASATPSTNNGIVTQLIAQALYLNTFANDNVIDANGFIYFLAYADASDGITASTINTDYVDFIITLNATAQLDNRPILSRIANLEGKVAGSTVEVPHRGYRRGDSATLVTPDINYSEMPQTEFDKIKTVDGTSGTISASSNSFIAQMVFQFDIVQEIERQLGRIPKATLANKVQWCKDNIDNILCNWYGFGSGPLGNKAYFSYWRYGTTWQGGGYNTAGSPTKIAWALNNLSEDIDSNGFSNFVAYADAAAPVANPTVAPTLSASGSGGALAAGTYYVVYAWFNANGESMTSPENNITITAGQQINVTVPTLPFGITQANVYIGTTSGSGYRQGNTGSGTVYNINTALLTNTTPRSSLTTNNAIITSTINTDYVELVIELKQSAVLYDPVVALYQVDDTTHYANILTVWNETEVLNRYPKVQGVQHLQNVYAIAEGENLIKPYTEWTYLYPNLFVVNSPYSATLNATGSGQISYYDMPCIVGQPYTLSINDGVTNNNIYFKIETYDINGVKIATRKDSATPTMTYTPVSGEATIRYTIYSITAGAYQFNNPMCTLGSVTKPFVPRNPSYLFATNKLGQIGTVKDFLYKQDGQWYIRKNIEKDIALDGSLGWNYNNDFTGFKEFYTTSLGGNSGGNFKDLIGTKYNGAILPLSIPSIVNTVRTSASTIVISVPDTDTGFGETYTPLATEIQAYFYGWQAKTVDGTGKPTAWRSLGDGTDAPTQTLAYVSVNKAPNFTPYKLSYVLATPVVIPTTVEGDIALNGPTQIQVGSGVIVREKVTPTLSGTTYHIGNTLIPGSLPKNKSSKYIGIYKNAITETRYNVKTAPSSTNIFGLERIEIDQANYDVTAEYTVTYMLFNIDNTKAAFTNNALEVTTAYDTSLKSVVDNLVEKQSDLMTTTSVNVQAIAELYKRVKALGG